MKINLKKTFLIIFSLTLFLSAHLQNNFALVFALTSARGMCVLEGQTNTVLYGQKMETKMPMASTTKIVTGILAIEHFNNLEQEIKVDDEAVGIEGTSIYLQKNEVLTIEELLYGLILASGNDCAVALACAVGQTEENFVKLMNDFAKKIGAINTNFENSHGLDSKNHYTTAKDLALMTSYAMKNDTFKTIVSTKFKQVRGNEKSGERHLRNKNKLVFSQENNVGVKTGFTDNAGRCLVNAVEQDDMLIITVMLNCGPMFEDARSLTNLALRNYVMKEFIKPYDFVGSTDVLNGDKNNLNIISVKGFKAPVKIEDEANYNIIYNIPESFEAPISKGDKIGTFQVIFGEEVVYEEDLISMEDIKNVDLKHMLNSIIEHWF